MPLATLAIDASRAAQKKKTGVENYSVEIIRALLKHARATDFAGKITLYTPRPLALPTLGSPDIKIKTIPFPRLWTHLRLAAKLLRDKPDVLFVPGHVLPIVHPKNCVITIHDIAFRRLKLIYPRVAYFYLHWSTQFAVKHAAKIIVPSEETAADLKKFYRVRDKQISVIPHGFDNLIGTDNLPRKNRILFLGRIEKKKNLIRLIEAFTIFFKTHPEWQLVLAGGDGFGAKEIHAAARSSLTTKKIHFPGYVSEAEKIALLRSAKIFAFPSLAEGFGFPVLEALSADTPVCAADIPSLRETGGQAALFVNPYRAEKIASAFTRLADDTDLCKKLIQHGREQIKLFHWKDAAEKTWKVLMEAGRL